MNFTLKSNNFSKDIYHSTITNIAKVLSNIVLVFFLARVLSIDEFGQFAYAFAIASICGVIVDFGYSLKLTKDCSFDPTKIGKILGAILYVKNYITFFLLLILTITLTINHQEGNLLIVLFVLSGIFHSYSLNLLIPYRSINQFFVEARFIFIYNLVLVMSVLIVGLISPDIILIAWVFLFVRLGLFFCAFLKVKRDFNISLNSNDFKSITKLLPFAFHAIIVVVEVNIDTILIKYYMSNSDVAVYQAGIKYIIGADFLLTIISQTLIPHLINHVKTNFELFKTKVLWVIKICGCLGILMFLCFVFLDRLIVLLTFGSAYTQLVQYMLYIGIIVCLRYFGMVFGLILTILNKQRTRSIGLFFSFCALILFDFLLIPLLGIKGALYAQILSHAILYSFLAIKSYKLLNSYNYE